MRPVRPAHYADSFWCTYGISVVAASAAEFVTYPLDLTKTRMQIAGEASSAAGKQTVIFLCVISKKNHPWLSYHFFLHVLITNVFVMIYWVICVLRIEFLLYIG
jgi:Mitochondrial carrier protein